MLREPSKDLNKSNKMTSQALDSFKLQESSLPTSHLAHVRQNPRLSRNNCMKRTYDFYNGMPEHDGDRHELEETFLTNSMHEQQELDECLVNEHLIKLEELEASLEAQLHKSK